MTMDNGEGRPLDEIEAGNEDPQGWYFDLPGGAWERQEEKNRTLRQRVLGNLSEDEAKAKSDPFGRKPAEPEKKEGGRGFFGRRKKDDSDSNQRTSAGGTWVLNRGSQAIDDDAPPAEFPPQNDSFAEDDDADDWSTEPPLKLTPFPRAESRSEPRWGQPDAGWDLSAPVAREPEAVESAAPTAFAHDEEPAQAEAQEGWQEPDSGTQDFLASMRSWAHEQQDEPAPEPVQFRAPTYEEAAAAETFDDEPEPAEPSLMLRPRQRETDEKQLDWNFGPAAWGDEPAADSDQPASPNAPVVDETPQSDDDAPRFELTQRWAELNRETDLPRFTGQPADEDEPAQRFGDPVAGDLADTRNEEQPAFADTSEPLDATAEEDPLESMRRWAERNRDADHPHFTVHHEAPEAELDNVQPAPIPLRPRAHDEQAGPSNFAPAPGPEGDEATRAPIQLPIARRPREEEPEPVHSEKWNDFFAITPKDDAAEGDDGDEQSSEGLAAMRAWAQKRPEPEAPGDIPEEFLKPFDWELEEAPADEAATNDSVPAELLKPFAWEEEAPDSSEPEPLMAEPAPILAFERPEPVAQLSVVDANEEETEDPLQGLFQAAVELPQDTKKDEKKKGRFGRLFGRGKAKEAEAAQETDDDPALGDWLLPTYDDENPDVRVAAQLNDWSEDAGTLEAPQAFKATGEGWGASLSAGWASGDRDAIQEFAHAVHEPAQDEEPGFEQDAADEPDQPIAAASFETAAPEDELSAFAATSDDLDDDSWNPEPVAETASWQAPATVPATDAQPESVDADAEFWAPTDDEPAAEATFAAAEEPVAEVESWAPLMDEAEAPVEAVASVETAVEPVAAEKPWWQQPAVEAEPEAPVEAVASVEPVEEPVAVEAPWWEQPAGEAEPEAPAEAVASVETVEQPVAAETPWWQQRAVEAEPETPVEADASVDTVEQPVAAETPWWQQPAVEAEPEAPLEAVASVETVEEPAAETPWWQQPAVEAEPEAPLEAVASVETVEEPAAETPWWQQPAVDAEPEARVEAEAVAFVERVEEPVAAEKPWWEQPAVEAEPEAPVEAVASVESVEEPVAAETSWWQQPAVEAEPEAPVEAVASVESVEEPMAKTPWWEQPAVEAEPEAPVEAVASVETVEEPVAAETPWWEQPAAEAEPEAPVEAVASVETVAESPWWERPAVEAEPEAPVEAVASVESVEEPMAAETPWWQRPAVEPEPEAPVEAVASVETVEEPVAAQTPWWEQPAVDVEPDAQVEAVASVETVEEPAAAETPWWEQPAAEAEPEAPVEAAASVEPVEEPVAAETPWWEQPAVEAEPETPLEAVASVEAVEEPVAAEAPWWEQPAVEAEAETPVEAVASVEPAEEPAAAETPWWQQPAVEAEPEAPVEAVASVEPVEEPTTAETPWWQQPAVEAAPDGPVEAIASVDPVEEPTTAETPWWQQPAVEAEPEAQAEAVASVEPVEEPVATSSWDQPVAAFEPEMPVEPAASLESPEDHIPAMPETEIAATVADADDDDPWADFVRPAESTPQAPISMPAPRWGHEPVRPPSDDDMWSHIAAQAEEHAAADHQLDLAASLESQMAEERAAPSHHRPEFDESDWDVPAAEPSSPEPEHEEDVILAAFERHAATPDAAPAAHESDEVFAELLGTEAADIVAEASDDDVDRSFIKMSGWAPQRRADFDGGWAPEQEVEQALSGSRPAFGGSDGAGFAPPSWAVDEFEGGPEAAPAAGSHHRTKTWIRELVETGLLALLVFLSVRASFQNFKVEGSSMWPTLENGEFLIVNKLVYSEVDMEKLSNYVPFVDAGSDPKRNVFHGPERGDIIVLKDPRNTETDLIKRVIGLPGETIEIVDGKVYINDHLLEEPYIQAIWHDTKPKVLIPPGEYFVMGDNRDNSLDSRSSQVGLVPQDLIIGKAMLSYWPRDKFGLAPNEEGKLGEEKPVLTTKAIGE